MIKKLRIQLYLMLWWDQRGHRYRVRKEGEELIVEPKWHPKHKDPERRRRWTRLIIKDNTVSTVCLTTGEREDFRVGTSGWELYDLITLLVQPNVTTDMINGYFWCKRISEPENNLVVRKDEHNNNLAKIYNLKDYIEIKTEEHNENTERLQ